MTATIAPWAPADRDDVIDLIVGIQQGEFGLSIGAADQPDLADVEGAYRAGGGEFWVARGDDGAVVGTIAALAFDENAVALRKMFVHESQRGSGLAGALMETVLTWARRNGYRLVLLGTTSAMQGAHRFYAKHGFTEIAADALPSSFPRMAVDSVFFRREVAGAVALRDHDPGWALRYEAVRERIADALGDAARSIEHIGSTAVPGLPAKPILDVNLLVADSRDEHAYGPALAAAGFAFRHREPEWFEHRMLRAEFPMVHLHVFTDGCEEAQRMVAFRDLLRADGAARDRYAATKRELARRDWDDAQDYADAKTEVVRALLGGRAAADGHPSD